jgi:hypothetical protein
MYNPLEAYEDQVRKTVDQAVLEYFRLVMDLVDEHHTDEPMTPDDVYNVLMFVLENTELNMVFNNVKLH